MLFQHGKAYSQDLRERVFALADTGKRVGEVAAALRLSVSYVSKTLSRRQRTGLRTALPQRSHIAPKLAGLYQAIRARVATHPDATIADLRRWLQTDHHVTVSVGVMWHTLQHLNLTRKKVPPGGGAGASQSRRSSPPMA